MKLMKILSKYKAADKFIKIALAGMLMFTTMISPAISYQQALSKTSQNTYTFGDVSATLNISDFNSSDTTVVYPESFIPVSPQIKNTGSNNMWAVLAVKIPTITMPYSNYLTGRLSKTYDKSGSFRYPAFYTVPDDNLSLGYLSNSAALKAQFTAENVPANAEETAGGQYCSDGWTVLGRTGPITSGSDSFSVYYYGYNSTLSPNQVADVPFKGLLSANFQNYYYRSSSTTVTENDYGNEIFSKNLGVEMRLFAIQSEGSEYSNIKDVWKNCKTPFSVFGTSSVVNSNNINSYTKGSHEVQFTVSKDVKKLLVYSATKYGNENADNKGQVIDLTGATSETVHITGHEDALKLVTVNVDFSESGIYMVKACSDNTDAFVNPLDMGQITVTE